MRLLGWGWFLQRITAALILIFLITHLVVIHIGGGGGTITFESVKERLQSPWFMIIDIGLLICGIYHALYGIRGIIFDFPVGERIRKGINWGFIALGMMGTALGIFALLSFRGTI